MRMSTEVGEAETETTARAPVEPLRLLAEDADDLHILSAALQDAILRPVDIVWEPASRRVTLKLSRFCWECGGTRVMAAMQFGDVSYLHDDEIDVMQAARAAAPGNDRAWEYLLARSRR